MRARRQIALGCFGALLVLCFGGAALGYTLVWAVRGEPPGLPPDRHVATLETLLPVFEARRVSVYRNQDWCAVLISDRGRFVRTSHPPTCQPTPPGSPFDPDAEAELRAIERAIASTSIRLRMVEVTFGADGRIVRGEFTVDCQLCARKRYVYAPDDRALPSDIPNERWHTRVNDRWHIVEEDWN